MRAYGMSRRLIRRCARSVRSARRREQTEPRWAERAAAAGLWKSPPQLGPGLWDDGLPVAAAGGPDLQLRDAPGDQRLDGDLALVEQVMEGDGSRGTDA